MNTQSSTNLSQKGALVLLGTSQWTARKLDKEETARIIAANNASSEAGRFNKSLLPGDDLIRAIATNISDFRQKYHYVVTLPWGDDGWRIIPAQRIGEYRAKYRAAKDVHDELVAKLLASYPERVEQAKVALAGLFKHSDYPSPSELGGKYRFDVEWNSITDSNDLRVSISEDAANEIRKEMAAATDRKLGTAVRASYERLAEVATALVDRLTPDADGEAKVFRNSLIGNVKELVDVLPSLNITDDPKLASAVDRLHGAVAGLSATDLRPSKRGVDPTAEPAVAERKAAVAKTAQDVLNDLAGVF